MAMQLRFLTLLLPLMIQLCWSRKNREQPCFLCARTGLHWLSLHFRDHNPQHCCCSFQSFLYCIPIIWSQFQIRTQQLSYFHYPLFSCSHWLWFKSLLCWFKGYGGSSSCYKIHSSHSTMTSGQPCQISRFPIHFTPCTVSIGQHHPYWLLRHLSWFIL